MFEFMLYILHRLWGLMSIYGGFSAFEHFYIRLDALLSSSTQQKRKNHYASCGTKWAAGDYGLKPKRQRGTLLTHHLDRILVQFNQKNICCIV